MKLRKNQSGFSHVEILLVVIVVALIGTVGWFVYDRNKTNDSSIAPTAAKEITNFDECAAAGNPIMESYPGQCAANGKTFTNPDQKVETQPDETADWLLYESPGKEYSIRLADGWQLERYQSSSSIYTFDNSKLKLTTGQKAIVTEVDGGGDGRTGLFINYATQNIDQIVTPGSKQSPLKTNDGLEVEKYYWIVSGYGDEGLGVNNGDTQYTYLIRKSAERVMTVNYSFQPGYADYHDLIEKVVKTAHFN